MAYKDYTAPGVNVIIERQQVQEATETTKFYPVYVGTGLTSLSRKISLTEIEANVSKFPIVTLDFEAIGYFNTQIFKETVFELTKLELNKVDGATNEIVPLVKGTDYEILNAPELDDMDNIVTVTFNVLDTAKVTATDLVFNFELTLTNGDDDFDLRLVAMEDRYYAKDIFGPHVLVEDGKEFFNDVAIAAEISFRTGTPYFYYLEVPRKYGQPATKEEIIKALDKAYYKNNAYRIVALHQDNSVAEAVSSFVTSLSNPVDRRETVAWVNYDVSKIADLNNLSQLEKSVGEFSSQLNNNRVCNVFGGESVELTVGSERLILPMYFMNVAIAAYDTVLGMADPLSTREISVFSKLNGPRFRPRQWDRLARYGVWIVYQNDESDPIIIRHQLTTAQSANAEDQEYSIVKNFDAVTKRFRDRLKPYAGQYNITDGYLERVDGTMTSAIEEVKAEGLAREITVASPWALRKVGSGANAVEEKRNLVSKWNMTPVYPANNLDVYLLI